MAYGATRQDPMGWQAIAQGRNAQDPMGWGAIAQQQQGNWNPNGLPPELLYALSGQVTPDQYMAGPAPMDPLEEYLAAYGANYFDPALEMTGALGGLDNPKYAFTNAMKAQDMLADRGIAGAEAAWKGEIANRNYDLDLQQFGLEQGRFGLDQGKFGLAQEANERAARESAADIGSPENDLMFLGTLGVDPAGLMADLTEDPDGTYENLGTFLNLTDETGAPNWRTTENITRLMGVIGLAQQQASQPTEAQLPPAAPPMEEGQRWGGLTQDQRTKEMYMRLVEGKEAVTDPTSGAVYTGVNAAERMNKVRAQAAANRAKPRPQPVKQMRAADFGGGDFEPRSLRGDISKNKELLLNYATMVSPQVAASRVGRAIPDVARGSWRYLTG